MKTNIATENGETANLDYKTYDQASNIIKINDYKIVTNQSFEVDLPDNVRIEGGTFQCEVTPIVILIAAQLNRCEIVKMLIEHWGVDIHPISQKMRCILTSCSGWPPDCENKYS